LVYNEDERMTDLSSDEEVAEEQKLTEDQRNILARTV